MFVNCDTVNARVPNIGHIIPLLKCDNNIYPVLYWLSSWKAPDVKYTYFIKVTLLIWAIGGQNNKSKPIKAFEGGEGGKGMKF